MEHGRKSSGDDGKLAGRLARERERQFVGRQAEQSLFASALAADPLPFAVLWLHGPGGVGKSSLLRRFARQADEAGIAWALLDAASVAPSPQEFLDACVRALGAAPGSELGALLDDGVRRVLLVDTAEQLSSLEGWLRETFLPALPGDCLVVFAGRQPPEPAWRRDAGWGALLRVLSLRNLPPQDSAALLAVRGVPPALRESLIRASHGHPLALALMTDAAASSEAAQGLERAPDVVRALLERFAHDAPDDGHRMALQACAHARVVNQSMLRDLFDEDRARDLFDWLRSLCFIEQVAEGLRAHDLAGEILDLDLRLRDPDRYRELHRKLRDQIIRRLATATGEDRLAAVMDLVWTHRFNKVLGPLVDWSTSRGLYCTPLAPDDRAPVLAAVERFEGAASMAGVRFWLDRHPEAFSVVRRGPGQPVGFLLQLVLDATEDDELSAEPVVAAAWTHARSGSPPRGGERLALLRWMTFDGYMQPGAMVSLVAAAQTAIWLGTPGLAWSFIGGRDLDGIWDPMLVYLDHQRGPRVAVGEVAIDLYAHDWRATPITPWLDMMAERELGGHDGAAPARVPALLVLAQEDFGVAVRQALRDLTNPDALERSPLVRCRLVSELPGSEGRAAGLRAALLDAVRALAEDPRAAKLHAALDRTYLRPTPTQEAAAERLGLPFSTYRRHLTAAVDRLVAWLWERELHGWPRPADG